MRLTLHNHACLRIDEGATSLVCDPWLEGTAFDDGWDLVTPTPEPGKVIEEASHVWFSHEHGDHFSPRALRVPPPEKRLATCLAARRTRATMLNYCRGLGYPTTDMPEGIGNGYTTEDLALESQVYGLYDSWLHVRAFDKGPSVLNLTDCDLTDEDAVSLAQALSVKGPLDVLCLQFNVACWRATAEEVKTFARELLRRARRYVQIFHPRYVLPFASFARFCHAENEWMNEHGNTVHDLFDREVFGDSTPVVLFPGDTWTVGNEPPAKEAQLERWAAAYHDARKREPIVSGVVSWEALVEAARGWCQRREHLNTPQAMALLSDVVGGGVRIRVDDSLAPRGAKPYSCYLSFRDGLVVSEDEGLTHLVVSSSSLHGVLTRDFGFDSLYAGGRIGGSDDDLARAMNFFRVSTLNHHGVVYRAALAHVRTP